MGAGPRYKRHRYGSEVGETEQDAAELLNDRVIPFYDEHGVVLQRVLTDRGTTPCSS